MLHTFFLAQIPDTDYLEDKKNYPGITLDDALLYFKTRNDRQLAYRNHSTRSNMVSKKIKQVRKSKTTVKPKTVPYEFIKPATITAHKRCMRCGGFGHSSSNCNTEQPVCFLCGDPEHTKADCPLRKRSIKQLRLQLLDECDEEASNNSSAISDSEPELPVDPISPSDDNDDDILYLDDEADNTNSLAVKHLRLFFSQEVSVYLPFWTLLYISDNRLWM